MAIPKIKLYRLDKSYDPSNDTDIQSVNDDEIYPFAEKSLDLTKFEQLVGVTYRDLMAGKSISGFNTEILMYNNGTQESPSYDRFKTSWVNCDGWRHDNLKVHISTDDGATYTALVPEKFYRLNFSSSPIFDDESNPTWKRQASFVQIEFGKWIYSGTGEALDFIPLPNSKPVSRVKIEYSLFTDDLTSGISSGESLSLQKGHIYDGTLYGRKAISISGASSAIKDENGEFLKPEGNIGNKIKTYPCRQKVAYSGNDPIGSSPSGRSWVKDLQIDESGKITITDCGSWIIAQTDDRRPRLFQSITVSSGGASCTSYVELEQGKQYTSTLLTDTNGNFNIVFQLSSEYYNFSYGVYLFPSEIFVRYNEEDDIIDDLFKPNYLDLTLSGDMTSGTWSKAEGTDTADLIANGSYSSIGKRAYVMALTEDLEHSSEDTTLIWNGSKFTIELPQGAYDGSNNTLKAWEDGVLIYSEGNIPSPTDTYTRKYSNPTISQSEFSMTLVDSSAERPSSILISYLEKKTFSNQKILNESTGLYENPWAVGWRICAYEKTKTANLFVSSFRNWVGDHLNNSPDVFEGYAKYDGSVINPAGINYISSGFSVLYRNGSVSFSNPVTQIDLNDVKNWPPSGLTIDYNNININELRLYTNPVNAKFAYYDALQDINNGIFRKISSGSNYFSYAIIDDPTYITENGHNYSGDSDAISKTSLKDKRWIIRNDSRMPTLFYKNNEYLPTPINCTESEALIWEPDYVYENKFLQINISSYRSIFVENAINPPPVEGSEIHGQIKTRHAGISWSPSYSLQTKSLEVPFSNSIIFDVECKFIWNQNSGRWLRNSALLNVFNKSEDISVDPSKEYYSFSSIDYSYSIIESPSGNPSSKGYYEKSSMNFSTREFDATKTIAQIFELRENIIYSTMSSCPYNISFVCCENGMTITAKSK